MTNEIKIGAIHVQMKSGDRHYPMYAWDGYGVVCRVLGTLNGNIHLIASHLISYINSAPQLRIELQDPTYEVKFFLEGKEYVCKDLETTKRDLFDTYIRAIKGEVSC